MNLIEISHDESTTSACIYTMSLFQKLHFPKWKAIGNENGTARHFFKISLMSLIKDSWILIFASVLSPLPYVGLVNVYEK